MAGLWLWRMEGVGLSLASSPHSCFVGKLNRENRHKGYSSSPYPNNIIVLSKAGRQVLGEKPRLGRPGQLTPGPHPHVSPVPVLASTLPPLEPWAWFWWQTRWYTLWRTFLMSSNPSLETHLTKESGLHCWLSIYLRHFLFQALWNHGVDITQHTYPTWMFYLAVSVRKKGCIHTGDKNWGEERKTAWYKIQVFHTQGLELRGHRYWIGILKETCGLTKGRNISVGTGEALPRTQVPPLFTLFMVCCF